MELKYRSFLADEVQLFFLIFLCMLMSPGQAWLNAVQVGQKRQNCFEKLLGDFQNLLKSHKVYIYNNHLVFIPLMLVYQP